MSTYDLIQVWHCAVAKFAVIFIEELSQQSIFFEMFIDKAGIKKLIVYSAQATSSSGGGRGIK